MERVAIQRFQLTGRLGTGGMGTVYRAHDPQLDRAVAIKVMTTHEPGLRGELSTKRTLDLRTGAITSSSLLAEARMMARLSHPNAVQVHEVGLDGAEVFVVMELVDGENLREWLAGTHDAAAICDVFAQAARGVAAAHAASIVHRDLKPENILVGRDGRVRVADFGLSRLAGPSYLRVADLGGTPKYMAPELWNGASPTAASDVYALCIALAEAFGLAAEDLDRARLVGLPPRVAALLDAGLSPEPARRPSAAAFEGALGPRRRERSRAIAIGVGAVSAVTVGVALALAAGAPTQTCSDDPALFATRWSPALRDALRPKLGADPSEAARVLAAVDVRASSIVRERRGVCEAERRGTLTSTQARLLVGCFERRAIELGAGARLLADRASVKPGDLEERLATRGAPCDGIVVAPPRDVPAVEALYLQFAKAKENSEFAAVEQAATKLGEGELEARAAMMLGTRQRDAGELPLATVTLERAYRRALAIKSPNEQAFVLAARSETAIRAGDSKAAATYAKLAHDLIEDGTGLPARTRVAVYRTLGRAELVRGNHAVAASLLKRGLAIQRASGERYAIGEVLSRYDLIDAILFQKTEATAAEGLALALETVERARALYGDKSSQLAQALNQVRKAYVFNHRDAEALVYARQALAILVARSGPEDAGVLHQRAEVAQTLLALHRIDEARDELTAVLAIADRTPGKIVSAPYFRIRLASAIFPRDPADGLARFERGLQELISDVGNDHGSVQDERMRLAAHQLDAGRLEAAAQTLATIDHVYAGQTTDRAKQQRARARGELGARLLLARGDAKAAETMARAALAAQVELGVAKIFTEETRVTLGDALVAQRRFADARPLFEEAIAIARAAESDDDVVAVAELGLARVEAGLGDRAAARARAERVREVLARYPDRPRERAAVAAFLRR